LKDACEKLLNMDQKDILQLGSNGRKLVMSDFSIELVNRQYTTVLKSIFFPDAKKN